MKCYDGPQPALDRAWDGVERFMAELPPPLDAEARAWLAHIGRGRSEASDRHRLYFRKDITPPLVFLPLWWAAGHPNTEPDRLDGVLRATMLGYFAIRLQDDVIDEAAAPRSGLLLANVFEARMHAHLASATREHRAFRAAFGRAWIEFSRLTLAEHQQVRSDGPYSEALFGEHCDKVAFARVPLLALAAGDGLAEARIAELVHGLGRSYGLTNDLGGWRRDLANGHRTWLLAEAGWLRTEGPGAEERIAGRLYDEGLADAVLARSVALLEDTRAHADALGLVGYDAYVTERSAVLANARRDVQLSRLRRAMSGPRGARP